MEGCDWSITQVCYQSVPKGEFVDASHPELWRRLLLGLCLFHAVVQERVNFGNIGWNMPHVFTPPDFDISRMLLHALLDGQVGVGVLVVAVLRVQLRVRVVCGQERGVR
jgi:hypothetical protein